MVQWRTLMATLGLLLFLTAASCGERPRVELRTPDMSKAARCIAADPKLGALPAYDAATLAADVPTVGGGIIPAGTRVVLLDRVRARDAVTSRFAVEQDGAFRECRSFAVYAVEWQRDAKKTAGGR